MKRSKRQKPGFFDWILTAFMLIFCGLILLPFLHLIAVSLSGKYSIMLGQVSLWPKEITLDNYAELLAIHDFGRAYGITLLVTAVGTLLSLSATSMAAYALSRRRLAGHKLYTVLVIIPLFFSGGMIPTYLLMVSRLGLTDNLWALILPGMISSWNLMIMRSFFEQYPQTNVDSGYLDGLNDAGVFFRLVLPGSKAALASIGLFYAFGYWNNYMDAKLYLRSEELFPIQMLLHSSISSFCEGCGIYIPNSRSAICATVITAVPVLLVYPFVQKHFIRGVRIGFLKS